MKTLKEFVEPSTHLQWWKDWAVILLGCVCMASGFVFFINPYNLVPGGIYGLSVVLHNLWPTWQIGTISYTFEIPLLIISFLLLGTKMGIRTIIAALITPMIMNLLSWWSYPSTEALQALDPTQLLGGLLNLSDHLMLASVFGGIVIGMGSGFVARNRATGGGTDIISMLVQKYLHIRFSRAILMVDGLVVLFGLLVIGLGVGLEKPAGDCYLSLYSMLSIYVTSRVVAVVITGFKSEQIVFVIGAHRMEYLRRYILEDLERSATCIKSTGLYSGEEKDMLFLVVTEKEVASVKQKIKDVEPDAFVVITDAYNIYGEGFRLLPSNDEIQPE